MIFSTFLFQQFKWFLMDDEKAEVLMEVTDFIFEDLIENFIGEINDSQK